MPGQPLKEMWLFDRGRRDRHSVASTKVLWNYRGLVSNTLRNYEIDRYEYCATIAPLVLHITISQHQFWSNFRSLRPVWHWVVRSLGDVCSHESARAGPLRGWTCSQQLGIPWNSKIFQVPKGNQRTDGQWWAMTGIYWTFFILVPFTLSLLVPGLESMHHSQAACYRLQDRYYKDIFRDLPKDR